MLDAGSRYPLPGDPPTPAEGHGPAGPPSAARSGGWEALPLLAAGLLAAAAVLAVVALFPAYYVGGGIGTALSATADQIVPTCVVAAAWLITAGLVASRREALLQAGAFGAAGLGFCYFGLRVADLGQLTTNGTGGGAGLWLLSSAWLAGAAGAALALLVTVRSQPASRLQGWRGDASGQGDRLVLVASAVAAVVLAVAFFPSWDRYIVTSTLDPTFSASFTAGNAFKNPALVIAGNVWAGASFGLVPIVALGLRPRRVSFAVIAGVLVVALSEVLSAVAQTLETQDPSRLVPNLAQISPSVSLQMTGWFDLEFASLLILALLGGLWSSRGHRLEPTSSSLAVPASYGWPAQPGRQAPGQWAPPPAGPHNPYGYQGPYGPPGSGWQAPGAPWGWGDPGGTHQSPRPYGGTPTPQATYWPPPSLPGAQQPAPPRPDPPRPETPRPWAASGGWPPPPPHPQESQATGSSQQSAEPPAGPSAPGQSDGTTEGGWRP